MTIDGCVVGWADTGAGAPVVLVHGGGFGAWLDPVGALLPGRVIWTRRTGYAWGPPAARTITVGEHAAHIAALIRVLDAGPATVVSHSSGCAIALQLALDHPDLVSRLVLAEPALIEALIDRSDRAAVGAALGPDVRAALATAADGDVAAALDTFLGLVCGPGWEPVVTRVLGATWRIGAELDAAFFFANEIPALIAWSPGDLAGLTVPTRLVHGDASPPALRCLASGLASLLPGVDVVAVPGANHLLPLTHPAELAALTAA